MSEKPIHMWSVSSSDGIVHSIDPDTCKHEKYTDDFDPICTVCTRYKIEIPATSGQQNAEKISDHIFKYTDIRIPWKQIWNYSSTGELTLVFQYSRMITVAEMKNPPVIIDPENMMFHIFSHGLKLTKENVTPEVWEKIQEWRGNHICPICKNKIATDQFTIFEVTNSTKIHKPANHGIFAYVYPGPDVLVHRECSENKETLLFPQLNVSDENKK